LKFNFIGNTKHFRPEHFCLMSTRNFGEGNNFKGNGKIMHSTQIHLEVATSVPKFDCGCNQ
jgi:hypothetical protein